jgi:hypothetical protein
VHKSVRLALVLAITTCALVALPSVAPAAKFTSSATPETIVGSGGFQTLKVASTSIKCASVAGESSALAFPTEQLVLIMIFTSCEVEGLGKAVLVCAAWNFHSTGTVTGGVDTEGTVTNGECKIEVVGGICKIIVPSQLIKSVTYTNAAPNITLKAAPTGIKYTSSAGCIGFERSGTNGGYAGEIKWKGKNGAKLGIV